MGVTATRGSGAARGHAAILDFAQSEVIDIIVMGRRSGDASRRPGLGSTAGAVVEGGVAPVLLVESAY